MEQDNPIFLHPQFAPHPFVQLQKIVLRILSGAGGNNVVTGSKILLLKIFENRPDLYQAAEVFQQENCSQQLIFENRVRIILAMYGAPKSETSLDNYRYLSFAKSTTFSIL